jgi:5-methylcytosine-specific restriction endonuclease McrA
MVKAKKEKKQLVPRTHNAGTMTESAFWSFIRSALRQKSRWWKPISIAKQKAKRAYKGKNKRQKFEYKCANCGNYFPDKEVNVDHIIPAGKLNCYEDLPGFVRRLFVEEEGLQVLCFKCHNDKTKLERSNS